MKQTFKISGPLLLIILGVILLIGALISLIYLQQLEKPKEVQQPNIPYPHVKRMALENAKKAFDNNNAIFIDVRGEPSYSEGHIPGALSITKDQIMDAIISFKPDSNIITYCT